MHGIMIVEDETEVREMLKDALSRKKYPLIEASNGKEALAKFKASLVDLVITDILMPDEDGLKVIMKLKEIKPSVKIIAISGGGKIGPASYLNIAKALGADEIIAKPFSLKTLVSRIEELLSAQQSQE
ncbi:MAG: response regulator [Bacteroidales bacterium]